MNTDTTNYTFSNEPGTRVLSPDYLKDAAMEMGVSVDHLILIADMVPYDPATCPCGSPVVALGRCGGCLTPM